MNKLNLEIIKQVKANVWFYDQIKALKKKLPKDPAPLIIAELGEHYDNYIGTSLVWKVLNIKTTDMNVLEAIKRVIEKGVKND
jgi:hypothetical protein